MSRIKAQYICQSCGSIHHRWTGKCDSCGLWNSLVEKITNSGIGSATSIPIPNNKRAVPLSSLAGEGEEMPRILSNIHELDRVTGGGFVRGSVLLIGGEPGIGKSTLLTQTAAQLSNQGHFVIYVSGEEAVSQIRLRAKRLGNANSNVANSNVALAAETNIENILATLHQSTIPEFVIIDSIQTLWSEQADSAPGTVTQVRLGTQAMINFAKHTGCCVILVGHVTKDGQIAGPRVVEHMVDGVFYFEGDSTHNYRILRAVKNRFGATDEIGVFAMSECGLSEISNPSELFLGERNLNISGASVFAAIEGTRPLLIEIQALVAPSSLGTARRAVVGWDSNRLSMIIAVLEAHCGLQLGNHDIYLNIAGGYRIKEPAADLAVAAALISSYTDFSLSQECVYFGEVSLSGAIRPVAHTLLRLKEAEKLGFKHAVLPHFLSENPKSTLILNEMKGLPDIVSQIVALSQKQKKNTHNKIPISNTMNERKIKL